MYCGNLVTVTELASCNLVVTKTLDKKDKIKSTKFNKPHCISGKRGGNLACQKHTRIKIQFHHSEDRKTDKNRPLLTNRVAR